MIEVLATLAVHCLIASGYYLRLQEVIELEWSILLAEAQLWAL